MKWPRVRFTVRRFMVLVVLVAVALASTSACLRYVHCRYRAKYYAVVEEQHRSMAGFHEKTATLHREMAADHREKSRTAEFESGKVGWRESAEFWEGLMADEESKKDRELGEADRVGSIKAAFERAARRPWRALPAELP